jgi:phospholipid/cholesterol/gamma-HCH transport system ATP-binding protein
MIEFRNITKAFGSKVVLDGINLVVDTGAVLFIIGASGAGKSVTVKHLIGLLRPDSGQILFDGVDITHYTERQYFDVRRRCAMVFQNSTLFDSMTLLDNVALPIRKHRRVGVAKARALAMEKLALVGMTQEAERFPADFGDGMRKKVAIARALTLDPEYIIFDEPTTGVDPISAAMIDKMIRRLADEQNVTCIVISHDLRSIFGIADRVVMLYKGKTLFDGTREELRASPSGVVQQFINGEPEGPIQL